MVRTFTLDYNALIDLEEKRNPQYSSLCKVLAENFEQLAITAVSASENPPINNFMEFKAKVLAIPELRAIRDGQILKPTAIFGFSFLDWSLYGDGVGQPMTQLKEDIGSILFSQLFPITSLDSKTRNKLADVMTLWCHIYNKRDIFVTSDKNFHRNSCQLVELAQNYYGHRITICQPSELRTKIQ